MSLQAIRFDRSNPLNVSVTVLDQLLLPYVTKYIPISTIEDGYTAIKSMQVRGAPAIAIVGSLSVLMETQMMRTDLFARTQTYYDLNNWRNIKLRLIERLDWLLESRPTAVNLSNSLMEIGHLLDASDDLTKFNSKLFNYVCDLSDDDLKNNIKLGDNGAKFLLDSLKEENFSGDFAVLTICNTGSLATSGYGTALGVIRSLWKDSLAKGNVDSATETGEPSQKKAKKLVDVKASLKHVYPLETRPYNQGSRLTAYELVQEKIPATLIPDSSIAYRIKTSPYPIKAAFVGADRIVCNGDTANKIGTFQLALICKQFGIKFYVVAPKTTFDSKTKSGEGIVIEERKPNEMKLVTGTAMDFNLETPLLDENKEPITAKVGIAPIDINVWNPSFDITPHEYIDGIVTENGVFTKDSSGNFIFTEGR
ncbi:hypothetical protein TPHA_0D03060 [Tetrapisispora phaffii CBS 4417]|uniref:Methylthioribose-1-phosphate isomerase n=1 Tax=Tetrapisispora phaffii (strain ATCC 24235 / CBS 4417 / NBRC 1672 / NRRL Y-8282 / UCD 70-5) TaxID=1071381 RepID=G8BSX1_TETPH|nr:hypothetical protein TPHA_0D03060 [Tetrapisispora phaffii CBS 4417]CCE62942.1 hypothetical protein TPHA_0D03060 [Tetrapisispora phaffii CBS 4417]